ncbi:MAG: 3-oxoacyl-[acyl-carrier-protein] reductase [Calditrichia bacterium]
MKDFENKIVVVTGAARGIGAEIAREFARRGAHLVITNRNEELLNAVAKEIRSFGVEVLSMVTDVSQFASMQEMIDKTVKTFGRVDVLVNNAGITRDNLLMRMSEEEWDLVLDTNLKGTFNCIKAVTRQMIGQKWGRIINIASVVGLIGNVGQTNYSASKAGIIGLTKSVARELASRNITCNAVAPGFIETDMTASLEPRIVDSLKAQIPLKRLGTVHDVAKVVCFLASEDAAYITGQVINVDGGMVMN